MARFVDALNEEIAALERQLEADPTFMKLREARRLLSIYAGQPTIYPPAQQNVAVGYIYERPKHLSQPKQPPASGTGAAAIEAAEAYLMEKNRPVPTLELISVLAKQGIAFGGKNPQNTLSSILSKSEQFMPNGRAGWTLAKTDGETKSADDTRPNKEASSADQWALEVLELIEPAKGREAGPGGGT